MTGGIIDIMPYNRVDEITSLQELKELFPEGYDHQLNWLFCSTGGAHGTEYTLDELQEVIYGSAERHRAVKGKKFWITILVIQPRLCNLLYGDILIGEGDIPFLRGLVKNTLEAVKASQEGNV